jgi:uncharacterized repeat protein (TIGR04052 family)
LARTKKEIHMSSSNEAQVRRRWRPVLLLSLALLAACGGGGDSVTLVTSDVNGGTSLPPPSLPLLSGTVAMGAPVAGATVQARCADGDAQALSAADGSYRIDLSALRPPCLLQADGGHTPGGEAAPALHGVALAFGNAPIHPLTELLLARATGAPPAQAYAERHVPDTAALVQANAYVGEQMLGLGLTRPQGALHDGAFAIGDATDRLLDALMGKLAQNAVSLDGLVRSAAQAGDLRAYVAADRGVAIEFVARAGDDAVACGDTLVSGLGSGAASARLKDLRFYVSAVELLRADGVVVPLKLAPNGPWQYTAPGGEAVTLIDLEDGSGGCWLEGNAETNAVVHGSVPPGRYVGLRWSLGVPESLNHSDTAAAPAPLDLVSMGWGWQAGRKFAKIEFSEPSRGDWSSPAFLVHLGSTGCTGNPGLGTVLCTRSNRGRVQFDTFDPDTQRIAVDVRALVQGADVTRNLGGAQGCMSGATDPECQQVFAALAIDWQVDGSGSGLPLADRAQSVFRVLPR